MTGVLDIFPGGSMVLDLRLEHLLGDMSEVVSHFTLLGEGQNHFHEHHAS